MLVEFSIGLLFLLMITLQRNAAGQFEASSGLSDTDQSSLNLLYQCQDIPYHLPSQFPIKVNAFNSDFSQPVNYWQLLRNSLCFLLVRGSVEARTATGKFNGSFHAAAVLAARLFDLVPFQLDRQRAAACLPIPCTMIAMWIMQNASQFVTFLILVGMYICRLGCSL